MKYHTLFFLLVVCIAAFGTVLPGDAHAFDRDGIRERLEERRAQAREAVQERVDTIRSRVCQRLRARDLPHLPPFCETTPPDPEPEPEDSDADGVPDASDNCPLIANASQTDTDGDGIGDACDDSPNGDPAPEPEPSVDHVLISEVLYDVGDGQGSEGDNEWVELYNPTDSAVDLLDWTIGDGISSEVIATTSRMLAANDYLIITTATSTADFWDFSGVDVVYLGTLISSGLSNSGDSVILEDSTGTGVDGVSYADSDTAFAPSVPDVDPGSSIERSSLATDTDSAADWVENTTPTPGT